MLQYVLDPISYWREKRAPEAQGKSLINVTKVSIRGIMIYMSLVWVFKPLKSGWFCQLFPYTEIKPYCVKPEKVQRAVLCRSIFLAPPLPANYARGVTQTILNATRNALLQRYDVLKFSACVRNRSNLFHLHLALNRMWHVRKLGINTWASQMDWSHEWELRK